MQEVLANAKHAQKGENVLARSSRVNDSNQEHSDIKKTIFLILILSSKIATV
jgi:hypothetical protein